MLWKSNQELVNQKDGIISKLLLEPVFYKIQSADLPVFFVDQISSLSDSPAHLWCFVTLPSVLFVNFQDQLLRADSGSVGPFLRD